MGRWYAFFLFFCIDTPLPFPVSPFPVFVFPFPFWVVLAQRSVLNTLPDFRVPCLVTGGERHRDTEEREIERDAVSRPHSTWFYISNSETVSSVCIHQLEYIPYLCCVGKIGNYSFYDAPMFVSVDSLDSVNQVVVATRYLPRYPRTPRPPQLQPDSYPTPLFSPTCTPHHRSCTTHPRCSSHSFWKLLAFLSSPCVDARRGWMHGTWNTGPPLPFFFAFASEKLGVD